MSPVYRAQCRTFKLAQEICGIVLRPDQGCATPGNHVLATFRAKRQYRTREAQALRDMVASFFRFGVQ